MLSDGNIINLRTLAYQSAPSKEKRKSILDIHNNFSFNSVGEKKIIIFYNSNRFSHWDWFFLQINNKKKTKVSCFQKREKKEKKLKKEQGKKRADHVRQLCEWKGAYLNIRALGWATWPWKRCVQTCLSSYPPNWYNELENHCHFVLKNSVKWFTSVTRNYTTTHFRSQFCLLKELRWDNEIKNTHIVCLDW